MKHRVKVLVPTEVRGLFGRRKTVMKKRTVLVDGKTYRALMKKERQRPYGIEEMLFYDDIFGDGPW
ncbi:MAG: hypothetical protein E7317_01745 [Clostridiales bacterium]|nr:hypothetical protein [Clostridiales bacterium]